MSAEPANGRLRTEKPAQAPAPASAPIKDLPPHLAPPPPTTVAPSFDIKHDIDALVERVRAVAMDRPYTPGSHIDWAGEDDDSLPDLDDWGVPSSAMGQSSEAPKSSVISPILQDTLKPLPSMADILISTPASILEEVDQENEEPSSAVDGGETPLVHRANAADSKLDQVSDNDVNGVGSSGVPRIAVELSTGPQEEQLFSDESAEFPDKTPQPKTAPPAIQHHPLPPKPVQSFNTTSKIHRNHTPEPLKADALEPGFESGLVQSMHAPSSARSVTDLHSPSSKDSSPERSLSASIHAQLPNSQSAPGHLSTHYIPRSGFNPTHSRAHTVGRFPPHHRPPHSAPSSEHSDSERPRRGDGHHHARTHSTPPTGPGTTNSRPHHMTRPIITGDAISRLARTLGGTSPPKKEAPVPNMTKE